MYAESYAEKEGWIGALGKAMIKPTVMIDDNFDNDYMWLLKFAIIIQSQTYLLALADILVL